MAISLESVAILLFVSVVFLAWTKKFVLQTRSGDDTLDHIICINIDGPSLDNFYSDKSVSDWTEFAITSRHLNGYNSSRTETRERADENAIIL